MKNLNFLMSLSILLIFTNVNASSLLDDAKSRQINETCSSYLGQIEESYSLNGLNITFAHPENPSLLPSGLNLKVSPILAAKSHQALSVAGGP